MNNNNLRKSGLAIAMAAAMGASAGANAAIEVYNEDGTSFSTDGYVNAFYVNTDVDRPGNDLDRRQSRVKMGFFPNYLGFNVGRDMGDLQLGARSSFWVNINDTDTSGTSTGLNVRQLYGTIGSSWGEILIGRDFGLFARSNLFLDEVLMGHGHSSDVLGLVDTAGVSFGNIGSGYPYAFPTSQITYRSPDLGGLKVAVGIMDPNKIAESSSTEARYEEMPRIESEVTYTMDVSSVNLTAWINGQYQKSETKVAGGEDVTSKGVGYGVKVSLDGLSLTASGFTAEGLNPLFTNNFTIGGALPAFEEQDTKGFLVQGSYSVGVNRFAVSYGEGTDDILDMNRETITLAAFHDVNDYLKLVTEYTRHESAVESSGADLEESDTFAVGAIVTW
ncbi:porin [Marinobacter sp. UBA2688]|jgi:predicted porin|uniref:porin n=1 Tax=Marinobacter sp. UBA2688 TaxID=1946816 RepID=UPI002579F91E|nr:porin [Marinobacter sp. UBA2688]|tara:strand:- start:4826 stop:5995 length:1170 start_codon:yes stop_codon:yes gene_type:complete